MVPRPPSPAASPSGRWKDPGHRPREQHAATRDGSRGAARRDALHDEAQLPRRAWSSEAGRGRLRVTSKRRLRPYSLRPMAPQLVTAINAGGHSLPHHWHHQTRPTRIRSSDASSSSALGVGIQVVETVVALLIASARSAAPHPRRGASSRASFARLVSVSAFRFISHLLTRVVCRLRGGARPRPRHDARARRRRKICAA